MPKRARTEGLAALRTEEGGVRRRTEQERDELRWLGKARDMHHRRKTRRPRVDLGPTPHDRHDSELVPGRGGDPLGEGREGKGWEGGGGDVGREKVEGQGRAGTESTDRSGRTAQNAMRHGTAAKARRTKQAGGLFTRSRAAGRSSRHTRPARGAARTCTRASRRPR